MKDIFVVDDSDTNLAMTKKALEEHYRVLTMPSAAKMFELLEKIKPDLILLDIEMPVMDGFEALQRLKAIRQYAEIPVIFLTGCIDPANEVTGFELGAVDFITKPFSTPVLLNRINTYLDIDEIIRDRTVKLRRLQNGIVYVLANMVESRDKATDGHIERTTAFLKILMKAMKAQGVYAAELHDWDHEIIVWSARLHDVGKITIPDILLNKPGRLTEEEHEIIKSHTLEGERIIDKIVSLTDEREFLYNAKLFAGNHHEHWDGSGYPRGLKGTEIPLQGRIMAIVDVYDALVTDRPYRKAISEKEAECIIADNAGKQFDPAIVKVFQDVKDIFREVMVTL